MVFEKSPPQIRTFFVLFGAFFRALATSQKFLDFKRLPSAGRQADSEFQPGPDVRFRFSLQRAGLFDSRGGRFPERALLSQNRVPANCEKVSIIAPTPNP